MFSMYNTSVANFQQSFGVLTLLIVCLPPEVFGKMVIWVNMSFKYPRGRVPRWIWAEKAPQLV